MGNTIIKKEKHSRPNNSYTKMFKFTVVDKTIWIVNKIIMSLVFLWLQITCKIKNKSNRKYIHTHYLNLDIGVSSIRDPKCSSWCLFLFPPLLLSPLIQPLEREPIYCQHSISETMLYFSILISDNLNYNKIASLWYTYKKRNPKDNSPKSSDYIKKWRI